MTAVKGVQLPALPDGVEAHVIALTGRLLEVTRQTLLAQHGAQLRPSHFRLLSHVPAAGTTITQLADVLFMTKQGVGQFVTQLQGSGHLQVRTDEQDRRKRLVARTVLGDQIVKDMNQTIATLEQHWQQQVGAERYRTFRDVLRQITNEPPP